MSKNALPLQVAKDGVVRIPKIVFEPLQQSSSTPNSCSDAKEHVVVRLDGTVDIVRTTLPPNNPAFAPRQAWPGGKIVTNDKLEVSLRASRMYPFMHDGCMIDGM